MAKKEKPVLPDWMFAGKVVDDIEKMPKDTIGFIYLLTFVDGTKYIGKKTIYNYRELPAKEGNPRKDVVEVHSRNTGLGYRQKYEVIRKESNWKDYQGSSVESKKRIVKTREILCYAKTKPELTYLEAKNLFTFDVLRNKEFLNDNIDGRYYRRNVV